MKIKLKIIKENKTQLNESRYNGLYDVMGVYPGSLDVFIRHFVENPIEVSREVYDFTGQYFMDEIEALTDDDIPSTSSRGRKTPLDKVKVGLRWGHTHWWNTVFGPDAAQTIIEFKVLSYFGELKDKLDTIGYPNITAEEFEQMPAEQKHLVYEKHFLEDHFDDFFDNHVRVSAMNTTGYVGNLGHGSGLYGQMSDWWMSGDGADIFKEELKKGLALLSPAGS